MHVAPQYHLLLPAPLRGRSTAFLALPMSFHLFLSLGKAMCTTFSLFRLLLRHLLQQSTKQNALFCLLGLLTGKKTTVVKKLEATPQVTKNSTWHQKTVSKCLSSACTRGEATQCLAPSTHNTEIFPALENCYRITSGNEQMQQAGERI